MSPRLSRLSRPTPGPRATSLAQSPREVHPPQPPLPTGNTYRCSQPPPCSHSSPACCLAEARAAPGRPSTTRRRRATSNSIPFPAGSGSGAPHGAWPHHHTFSSTGSGSAARRLRRLRGRPPASTSSAANPVASGPSLLPAAFTTTVNGTLPHPAPVKLGAYEAYRYSGLFWRGLASPLTLRTVPTTGGVVRDRLPRAPLPPRRGRDPARSRRP